jgi:hypothetical protein
MAVSTRSVQEWDAENGALPKGEPPAPCPVCRRRGFYAPRAAQARRYFACKFCGYWQDVGKPPHEIIRYECNGTDHAVADWKQPTGSWSCPMCARQFSPKEAVPWPNEVPNHPWHSAPTEGEQSDFVEFWRRQGMEVHSSGII